MWVYEKKLQYPVKIKNPNPQMAQVIMSQIGGADSETGAAMRYLNQRYAMPTDEIKGLLTDIGTEELAPPSYTSPTHNEKTKTPAEAPQNAPAGSLFHTISEPPSHQTKSLQYKAPR